VAEDRCLLDLETELDRILVDEDNAEEESVEEFFIRERSMSVESDTVPDSGTPAIQRV
jgi:hypothetical protein